ncbi:SAM-dependent methyltransferase [Cyanobium sp. Morenito 9A2]|uniref:SAM-dependent methyltransferase n=1 Tax=Cyanobium sp. Morenito 9A2 TaxID=2823718 RepID=UPI0020CC6738|nr:SAM-dependent methyltransferase [Cyanobium sp. Morenito 9A2]MCP9848868.1 SAM-dependent methyltransferase [Cyanobium sp. Morenito 9A2]
MFALDQVVPWGRSFAEYIAMFALGRSDMTGRILGCGDGPASFNAESTRKGAKVVSSDPLYSFDKADIEARIAATYEQVIDQTRKNQTEFIWKEITSVEELGKVRMAAMRAFLDDYPAGLVEGRYLNSELPALPFHDGAFDLGLCSHLLFLYSQQLDETFHHASLLELCRVAKEVRVFPVLALGGAISPHLEGSVEMLRAAGHLVSIERVSYEFQRGAREMLRIKRDDG